MSLQKRTPLQDQVVRDLIDSRAIDFEVIGNLFGKYGAQAARDIQHQLSPATVGRQIRQRLQMLGHWYPHLLQKPAT